MLLVIADDLTGAAEMGGVAVRFGLNAEVHIDGIQPSCAGVVAVDTDTRSCSAEEASARIRALDLPHPFHVYKKVDSVLRGHVVAELNALMAATGRTRALLVPCNPELGRTIHNGHYWIGEVPIHETEFHFDPEYPVVSPEISAILNNPDIQMAPPAAELPFEGLIVGEATTEEHVSWWAAQLDETTLAAGAASFFSAILRRQGHVERRPSAYEVREPVLVISGSASYQSRTQITKWAHEGTPVLSMETQRDACPVIEALRNTPRVVLTGFGPRLNHLVETVLRSSCPGEVWVEGGATASALLRHLKLQRLRVIGERAPGVVALSPNAGDAPLWVVKPGSYRWPDHLRS